MPPQGSADSTARFTNRVADYVRCRPGYPEAIVDALAEVAGLSAASVVADVGSGTGISTGLLLRHGCTVFAVEPNGAMRAAAEQRLKGEPRFRSVNGSAEATTLPSGSVDAVTAAQSFHWFDLQAARREFTRILRPGGWVALFWNERRTGDTAFLREYEALLTFYGTDYQQVRHENVTVEELQTFFSGPFQILRFPNEQVFDFEGLRGRLLSSSYAPPAGHPQHERMLRDLRKIFDTYREDDRVRLLYDTRLYCGRLLE